MAPLFTSFRMAFGLTPTAGAAAPFSATGGTKSTPGDGYTYHVYPHSNWTSQPNFTFEVEGNSGAPVVDTTIHVMCTGSGGGGGGGKPGPSNQQGGQGGAGAATGYWTIPIIYAGEYYVTTSAGGTPGPENQSSPSAVQGGPAKFWEGPLLAPAPTAKLVQAGAGTGGAFAPEIPTKPSSGGTNTTSWSGATIVDNLAGEAGEDGGYAEPGEGGKAGGYDNPTKWWYPYMAPGNKGQGRPHGQPQTNPPAPNYGGGGAGGQGGFDGPDGAGDGGAGPPAGSIVVIRYQ